MKNVVKFILMLTGISENLLSVVMLARIIIPAVIVIVALLVFLVIVITMQCCS